MTARGPGGERTIAVPDLFQGYMSTAVAADEVITEVRRTEARRVQLGL